MNSNKLNILLIWTLAILISSCGVKSDIHEHEDHNEISSEAGNDHEDHSNHDHDVDNHSDDKVDDHDDEEVIILSAEAVLRANISTATAEYGQLTEKRKIYGQVNLNEDAVIHIFPRYPGIVRKVYKSIGDNVSPGDTLVILMNSETFKTYPVISEMRGEVLDKHAVIGEVVDGSEFLLTIGDLSQVWVDLQAYEQDLKFLSKGDSLTIYSIDGNESTRAAIAYIKPVMDPESRTTLTRCIISEAGRWNPGKFIFAMIEKNDSTSPALLIPRSALVTMENEHLAFVPGEPGEFHLHELEIGRSSGDFVEVLSGLEPGTIIVNNGAYELKAQMITSSFSGHAGHGH